MSKSTVIALAGKRLVSLPSPTTAGHVLIQVLSADRAVQASLTLSPDAAAVFADALSRQAVQAEAEAQAAKTGGALPPTALVLGGARA